MRNKKGAIVSGLTTILLYFGFVLLLIVFFFIFKFSKGGMEVKISNHIANTDLSFIAINYLKTQYILDGEPINMADFLALYKNEKDETKRKFYYDEILKVTKEIFDPKEYCYVKPGIRDKVIVGYAVFILDKETYNGGLKSSDYAGTQRKKDKKFRSNNFMDSRINEDNAVFIALPTNSNEMLYLGFFKTTLNIFGKKSKVEDIPGCS
jgi:hypothetical protein